MIRCLWTVLMVLSWGIPGWATPLDSAKTAYWKGDFATAATGYQTMLKDHPTQPDLWYNLGTAQAQAGRLGEAVFALEQAVLLDPSDQGAAHNLERIRSQIIDKALKTSSGETLVLPGSDDLGTGLLSSLEPRLLEMLFALSWPALFLVIILASLGKTPGRRTGYTFGAVVLGLIALSAGGLLLARSYTVEQGSFGVLVNDKTTARRGPGAQYAKQAVLAAGVKVRVSGTDRGWQQVALPNGLGAWIKVDEVKRLKGL